LRFAVGDRSPNLRCYLFVEVDRPTTDGLVPAHGASYISFILLSLLVDRPEVRTQLSARSPFDAKALIGEARARQRRRRAWSLAAIVAALAAAGIGYAIARSGSANGPGGGSSTQPGVVALSDALARQQPVIGIACPDPNITTCGRIGVAVWLQRPATSASATLAGVSLRLHPGGLGGRGRAYWEGYVHLSRQQLRLPVTWAGEKPVRFMALRLRVNYPNRVAVGSIRVRLRPGWG
jgi:hypothetical protein